MSHRLPRLSGAAVSRTALPRLVLFGVLLVGGCGPGRDEFAPACPTPIFEQTLSDIARYRPGANGRDLTDLVLAGRLVSVSGQCALPGKNARELQVAVRVGMQIERGPAMEGNTADLPVFIAITDGNTILDKQTYTVRAVFPSNVQLLPLAGGPIDMTLPITPEKSGAAYQIRIGFQLSAEELAANRKRLATP
jgi:hypothetical protein